MILIPIMILTDGMITTTSSLLSTTVVIIITYCQQLECSATAQLGASEPHLRDTGTVPKCHLGSGWHSATV